jgi:DNA polymerase family A
VDIICLDFETFYSKEYSLSRSTVEEYVRRPQFEVHGVGIRWPDGQLEWCRTIPDRLRAELAEGACLAHHAHFDGLILNHHFNIRPRFWLDTLSMSRQVVGNHLRLGLDALAKHYSLAGKSIDYASFKGLHFDELTPAVQTSLAAGCLHDVALTFELFRRLAVEFPKSEYPLVDLTVRMFVEPALVGDLDLFAKIWHDERDRKAAMLAALGISEAELHSSARFAGLLRRAGVEPELKPGKLGDIYAFARVDKFMRTLQDGDNELAANLARARLGVKSTIVQSRVARLGDMASRGAMPVYLQFNGAHTGRWSGGDKVNWQNFRKGVMRQAIKAPKGFLCAVVDAAQIECRLLSAFADEVDDVAAFRQGADLYCRMASTLFRREVTKTDTAERALGKQLILGCGYGAGAATIQRTARLGIFGPPLQLTDEQAEEAKRVYRATHKEIIALWGSAGLLLPILADPTAVPTYWDHGVWVANGRLWGPNGGWVDYETLKSDGDGGWVFRKRDGWRRIWGGVLVENLIQFLARIHLGECMKELTRDGFRIVLHSHDEVVAIVKDDADAEKSLKRMIEVMSRSPTWMPEVPLAAEGGIGVSYGEAK